jgi:two-component system, cell cycle sensor histidine kinase and response regulator CckA
MLRIPRVRPERRPARLLLGKRRRSPSLQPDRQLDVLQCDGRQDRAAAEPLAPREAQQALRESEARYRALVESQIDLISRYRPDTTLTFVNDAFCRFYGSTRDELIGKSFLLWVAPEFREGVLQETRESAKVARTTIGEYLNYTQDGQPCWIHWIIRGIPDEHGRVVEFQAVGRDITPIKDVEEALRQANLVVEKSPVVLFRWTASEGWPVAYVSQNVVQFGYTPGELLAGPTRYTDLVHPQDLPRFSQELREYAGSDTARFQREYRILGKDGQVRWVDERTAVERDEHGRIVQYQGIVIDITDRKNAELQTKALQDQLQHAMKMEALGRLAGGVAHDFNNLLTAISGNLECIDMDLPLDSPVRHCLREASRASQSAASLVRQLLSFSRRQLIEPKVIDLRETIESLRTMLVRVIGEHIAMDCVSPADLGLVELDPGQLEQILMNLAVNARDAMPGGGKLTIETANVEPGRHSCSKHAHLHDRAFVRLRVSDTGCGMTDEVKEHLFEPFFTTKPLGRGTGLGLATTFGIVEQAGGCIDVQSEPGLGTTLEVHLPRAPEPEVRPTPPVASGREAIPVGGETILLVEDDANVRNLATLFLKRLGYQVLVAANGRDALALVSEGAPAGTVIDLLLTDVVMPGMNGRQLAERLRSVRPALQVLYSSGYTDDVIVHHGNVQEQLNFISKPYSFAALGKKIRQVLDGR